MRALKTQEPSSKAPKRRTKSAPAALQTLFIKPYKYEPLPNNTCFRYIELLPGRWDEEIEFRLHLADWDNPPAYEAISYTWGDAADKIWTPLDGKAVKVPANLLNGLRQMRLGDRSKFLWADAICIDQGNVGERNHQVDNMRRIYKSASQVLVWLGLDEDNNAEKAIIAIQDIARACCTAEKRSVECLREIDDLENFGKDIAFESLLCYRQDFLKPLCQFFLRPWFLRLWVIQEVNSGSNIMVLWGVSQVSWDIVGLAANYIWKSVHLFPEIRNERGSALGVQRALCHAIYMRNRGSHKTQTMLSALHCSRPYVSSDPLDKIYALLGMPAIEPVSHLLQADYQKSPLRLYRDVVQVSFKHMKNLDALSYTQHEQGLVDNFPSWIPRWDEDLCLNALTQYPSVRWDASRGFTLQTVIEPVSNTVKFPGVSLDTITSKMEIDRSVWFSMDENSRNLQNHPILRFIRDKNILSGEEEDLDTLLCFGKVLIVGLWSEARIEDSLEAFSNSFLAYVARLMVLTGQNPNLHFSIPQEYIDTWSWYEDTVRNMLWGRCPFATQKGYMGSGRDLLQPGDKVCVLFGGRVPYILRPKEGYYQLVGEAYIPGFMDGEAMDLLDTGELTKEVFEVC